MVQLLLLITTIFAAYAAPEFPTVPDAELTPGSYCTHPDSHRYPEHIAYCRRNVSGHEKWAVIEKYNRERHFNIQASDRSNFKIDHLIPLCAGGSNEMDNLWPQHRTVYEITDPLEGVACEKMAEGRLLQRRAIELLMRAKTHLSEAPDILHVLEAL